MTRKLFFSRKQGAPIGSFSYGLGLVHIAISPEGRALLKDPSLISRYKDDPKLCLQYLLEVTAWFHEHRHYLDSFGTLAGMSVYAARVECLTRFMEAGVQLRKRNLEWKLPMSRWAKRADCPQGVRALARFARAHRLSTNYFFGDYDCVAAEGHLDASWTTMPVRATPDGEQFEVPAFPYSTGFHSTENGVPTGAPTNVTVFYPLGYEALLEGAAQSMARGIVELLFQSIDPQFLVRQLAVPELYPTDTDAQCIQQLAEGASPYNATDFLISKFLRGHGVDTFPRELVLKLTDIALSRGMMVLHDVTSKTTVGEINSAALAFVQALESASVADLKASKVDYPPHVTGKYRHMLDDLRRGGDWDTVEDPDAIESALRVWQSFLAHHVTIPLLEERLRTEHASYFNAAKMLDQILDKERPCVEVVNQQIKFNNIPKRVQEAWVRQMMIGEIAHQVFADADVILCPRAHDLLPGMRSVDLTNNGGCNNHERLGCGSWGAGQKKYRPDCLFTNTLATFGFIPIASKSRRSS